MTNGDQALSVVWRDVRRWRLSEIDYKGVRPDNIGELARAAAKVDGRRDEA